MKYNNYSIESQIDGEEKCPCCGRRCCTSANYKTGEYEYTCRCGYHEKHVIPKTQEWVYSNKYVTFHDYPMWYKRKMKSEANRQKQSYTSYKKKSSITKILVIGLKRLFS